MEGKAPEIPVRLVSERASTMLLAVLVIATFVFVRMLKRLQVTAEVRRAVTTAIDASAVVRSKSLSDDEKQKAIQKAAIASLASLLSLLLRTVLALFAGALVVALGLVGKFYAIQDVVGAASDWTTVLALSLATVAAWFLR